MKQNLHHGVLLPIVAQEFYIKDILQVIIGATILAIPVGFTEETWHLGAMLPWLNIIGLLALSLFFISAFVYYNYHRHHKTTNWVEFIKRVVATYAFTFLVVALILTLIQRTPWATETALAFKRVIIVSLPSSMSAVVADLLK